MTPCPICEANRADLGRPSAARWIGPDGEPYCSMHFVNRFGHSEPLVKIAGYQAPKTVKKAAPKNGRRKRKEAAK